MLLFLVGFNSNVFLDNMSSMEKREVTYIQVISPEFHVFVQFIYSSNPLDDAKNPIYDKNRSG